MSYSIADAIELAARWTANILSRPIRTLGHGQVKVHETRSVEVVAARASRSDEGRAPEGIGPIRESRRVGNPHLVAAGAGSRVTSRSVGIAHQVSPSAQARPFHVSRGKYIKRMAGLQRGYT